MGQSQSRAWSVLAVVVFGLLVAAILRAREAQGGVSLDVELSTQGTAGDELVDLMAVPVEGPRVEGVSSTAAPGAGGTLSVPETGDISGAAKGLGEDPPGRILVRVVDENQARLSSVTIIAGIPGGWDIPSDVRRGETGAVGEFLFEDFPAGRFLVELVGATVPEGHAVPRRVIGRIRSGETKEVTLACEQYGAVTGQVLRSNREPIPRLRLHLSMEAPTKASSVTAYTDEDGRFRAGPMHPGRWWVAPWTQGDGGLTGAVPGGQWIEVAPGETTSVQLAARSQGMRIRGRVVDQYGGGVEGLRVSAHRPRWLNGELLARDFAGVLAYAHTDPSGHYEVGPIGQESLVDGQLGIQIGARHATSGVTSDGTLLERFPEPFLTEPAQTVTTTVARSEDFIEWRVRLTSDPAPGAPDPHLHEFVYKIGYCTLPLDRDGTLTFLTARSKKQFKLMAYRRSKKTVKTLTAPDGHLAEIELRVPFR